MSTPSENEIVHRAPIARWTRNALTALVSIVMFAMMMLTTADVFGRTFGKPIKGSRCLVLGIAYKKNVDDIRESPAAEIMEQLRRRGALLGYSDPHVPAFPRFDLESVRLSPQLLAAQDVVLITTDHDAFDFALVKKHARLIVDTRGVYLDPAPNVVKA